LKTAFGRINKELNKYVGKLGLEREKKELIQFKKKMINYQHLKIKE